jgi:hypothetical protein
MNKELLKRMIRVYFDSIDVRFRSDIQRQDEREEVLELCYEAELDSAFINEIKSDTEFKPE